MRVVFTCTTILLVASISVEDETTFSQCGHCKGGEPCSDSGCPEGCEPYWVGPACNTEIPPVPDSHTNCSWVVEADATSLKIGWCQIENLPGQFINHYGYFIQYVRYQQLGAENKKTPTVTHNASSKIQTLVIPNLKPHSQYEITVWPYRTADGEYDHRAKYETIVGETRSEPGGCPESGLESTLPWILFGVACLVIIGLIVTILSMYLKYIRTKSTPPDSLAANASRSPDTFPTLTDQNPAIYEHILGSRTNGNQESCYQHLTPENAAYQSDNKVNTKSSQNESCF